MAWDKEDFLNRMRAGGEELANPDTSYDENRMDMLPNEQMAGGGLAAIMKAIAASAPKEAPIDIPESKFKMGDKEYTMPRLQIDPTMMAGLNIIKEAPVAFNSFKNASKPISTFGEAIKPGDFSKMREVAQEAERSRIAKLAQQASENQKMAVPVGKPYTKDFQLVGEPYGGPYPAKIPPQTDIVQSNARIPDAVLGPETTAPINSYNISNDLTKNVSVNQLNPTKLSNEEFVKRLQNGTLESPEELIARQRQAVIDNNISPKPITIDPNNPLGSQDQSRISKIYKWAKENPKTAIAMGLGGIISADKLTSGMGGSQSPSIPTESQLSSSSSENLQNDQPSQQLSDDKKDNSNAQELNKSSEVQPIEQQPVEIPIDTLSLGSDSLLKRAMKQRDDSILVNQLIKGASQIGGAIAGSKAGDTSILDENIKNSDRFVKDYQERIENQDNDPNSAASQAMRNMALKLGFKFGDNVSAADIKKQIPQMTLFKTAEDNRAARQHDLNIRRSDKEQAKIEKNEAKNVDWLFNASKASKDIVDNYTKAKGAADSVRNVTGSPAQQITALYGFVKGLDPTSAVREGEVGLARAIASLQGKAETMFNQVSKGGIIDQKTFNSLKDEIIRLEGVSEQTYNKRMSIFREQAKLRGIPEEQFKAFDPYYGENKQSQSSVGSSGLTPTVRLRRKKDGKENNVPSYVAEKFLKSGEYERVK